MKRTNSFYGPSKRVFTAGEWLFSKLRGGAPAFSPADLNPVVWYDPSDMSTLFQDSAGTIPVTAAGQSVGLMRDKSGNNHHASQATSTKRPLLQTDGTHWWLKGDGIDDFMQTGNIDLTGTDKVSVFAGVRKITDTQQHFVEYGDANYAVAGGFLLRSVVGGLGWAAYSGTDVVATTTTPSPTTNVMALLLDMAGTTGPAQLLPRLDGVPVKVPAGAATPAAAGSNQKMSLLARGPGAVATSGHLYPLIIVPRLTTDEETSNTEKWVAEKTGVTLPTFVARYAYSTPASGGIPAAGQLVHADSVINKWNISRTDLDGNVITGDFLENGDTMVLNGVTYTLEAEQFFTDYIALTIEPTTQQPDGTYTIGVYT